MMAFFIHNATGTEASESDIKSRFSTRAFSSPMTNVEASEVGYSPLIEVPSGATEMQNAVRGPNQFVNGQWQTSWSVSNKSLSELKAVFETAVQKHLEDGAAVKGYDSILSACSYAGAANPFQAEGQAYLAWRGAVWMQCYADLAAIQAGTMALPASTSAYIATLPASPY